MNRRLQIVRSCRSRRGLSVAEATIAATILSSLTVAGMTVVCLLMTAEQRTAESVVVERTIAALADELRRDARGATVAERIETNRVSLQLSNDTQAIYECTDDGVWRREQLGDRITRQEKFHLPFGDSRFEPVEEGLIVWIHEREIPTTAGFAEPSATSDQPQRAYRVEAAVVEWSAQEQGDLE